MVRWVSAIGVCLGLVFSSVAGAQTGKELLHACELLRRGMHVEGNTVYLPPGSNVVQCWGFIEAVAQYTALTDQDGKPRLNACPGPDTTVTEVLRVFVEYGEAHPEKLDMRAAGVAYEAMTEAFPCSKSRRSHGTFSQ